MIGRALRKIMAHSNHFKESSGYATQVRTMLLTFIELGYEVALSAFHGQAGYFDPACEIAPGITIPVYPAGQHAYGGDSVGMHARHWGADLVISLMDQWAMSHETLDGIPYAAWMPVDTVNEANPKCALGLHDANSLATWRATVPIAMSQYGHQVLTGWQAEFNKINPPNLNRRTPVLYVPHAIDTETFKPHPHRDEMREAMGIDDRFAVSLVAANRDKARKQFPAQMAAFRRFHARHAKGDGVPVLMLHTEEDNPHGMNLRRMAERIGLPAGSYRFSAQYLLAAGMIEDWRVAGTMSAADLGTQAAAAEGFGLPIAETLACGTPVVVADHPVTRQVAGPGGWFADAEDVWATGHEAWWRALRAESLLKIYETAWQGCWGKDPKAGRAYETRRAAARQHVVDNFAVDVVRDQHWVPVLKQLGEHFGMD